MAMIDKNRNRWMLHLSKKPALQPLRLIAAILFIATLATLPLTSLSLTNAKYIAATGGSAAARVAKWEVDVDILNLPAKPIKISPIPYDATEAGHPLVLFFEGVTKGGEWIKKNASFPLEIINDSEVTARYKVKTLVKAPAGDGPDGKGNIDDYIFLYDLGGAYDAMYDNYDYDDITVDNDTGVITIEGAGEDGADLVIEPADNGIILAPREGSRIVDVVITPCTFTDLEFWLYIEQVN